MPYPTTSCASTNAANGGRVARYSPASVKATPPAVSAIRIPALWISAPVLTLASTNPAELVKNVIPIVARPTP